MTLWSPVDANEIRVRYCASLGSVSDGQNHKPVGGETRQVDIAVCFDNVVLGFHCEIMLDVCDKLMEVHLGSAGWGNDESIPASPNRLQHFSGVSGVFQLVTVVASVQ
jgi:hypothetical protein